MAPLADVPLKDLPGVFERIDARLMAETSPDMAAKMMVQTLTLAGIRLSQDQIDDFGRRLRTMNLLEESSFYKLILTKGELREARKLLIRLGRVRFGQTEQGVPKSHRVDRQPGAIGKPA